MTDNQVELGHDLHGAPVGTFAPAVNGGGWLKEATGRWRWNGHHSDAGGAFPRPGADWTGRLIHPDADDHPAIVRRGDVPGVAGARGPSAPGVDEVRREVWADASAVLNDHADVWEEDGSDPCRVRICREMANAFRTYAEGVGVPSIDSLRRKRREAEAERDRLSARVRELEATVQRVRDLADEWERHGKVLLQGGGGIGVIAYRDAVQRLRAIDGEGAGK